MMAEAASEPSPSSHRRTGSSLMACPRPIGGLMRLPVLFLLADCPLLLVLLTALEGC